MRPSLYEVDFGSIEKQAASLIEKYPQSPGCPKHFVRPQFRGQIEVHRESRTATRSHLHPEAGCLARINCSAAAVRTAVPWNVSFIYTAALRG
jgi:hypothetical protein